MTDRELMQQALKALVYMTKGTIHGGNDLTKAAITALRERLAQPVQEPVAWRVRRNDGQYELYFVKAAADRRADCFIKRPQVEPLYTAPPRREWVGLTDAERGITAAGIWGSVLIAPQSYQAFARAIEAKLRAKNGGGV